MCGDYLHLKTLILTGLGFIFLGLGAIGLLLPVWPTTPFVLLSVACFSSEPHIKSKIMKIPFFREHIENYENKTGLSKKTFWSSIIWLWSTLLISMILVSNLWISLLLLLVGLSVTFHLSSITRRQKGAINYNYPCDICI